MVGLDAACSSDGPAGGASCPADLPSSCPSPPPSFQHDVEPIFERRCWACHTKDGVAAARHDFSTYASIASERGPILNQFYACNMPPPDAGQPTSAERAALLGWLVCKAPNN
jgi:hypothetical protein